jgi:hypothetical protein
MTSMTMAGVVIGGCIGDSHLWFLHVDQRSLSLLALALMLMLILFDNIMVTAVVIVIIIVQSGGFMSFHFS